MKKNFFYPLLLFTFSISLLLPIASSCSDDKEDAFTSPKLKTLTFEPEHNKELEERVIAVFSGKNAEITIPYHISTEALIATFTYQGELVKIGEIEQISGETRNNFTDPLTYKVFSGKEVVEYTVTVKRKAPRIPIIRIKTENQAAIEGKEKYVNATIQIDDPDKLYTDGSTFSSATGIKGRGNSTWGMPKKPYRLKLDQKASLLGMSTDKDWALLANYSDKTLLRNLTAFEISRIVGMQWTPSSLSVELYLNNEYKGVYALTEHVKVSEERVDLDLVTPSSNSGEALTGDYFLELDFHADEENLFKTSIKELPIMFKDPENPTTEQFKYVEDFFNTAESSLYSTNFADPLLGYSKYIDIESFINYYIIQELTKNVDGNMRGSCYLTLRRNGKIEQPLVWDFDIAFGNANHIVTEQGASSVGWDGWYIKTCSPWFDQLFKDPVFVQRLKERWNEVKPQLDQIPNYIREHAEGLKDAQQRNFSNKMIGGAGWDIHEKIWPNFVDRGSYSEEIIYLTTFVKKRLEWLDTNINNLQ
ncbi:CotH kinase family protein [Dysgonomonas sp. Marseille-P4361]|uniref:CotH kinase family protein n=1 Tax=Dysgonomonas sp. Marseille-P4361 TaxID=2161820 RepID=UPI000D553C52|nr:CotH kinase family protein [Dysgonomonas sp. Marseille-P4361]